MADEKDREELSGEEVLDALYSGALDDGVEKEELDNLNMGNVSNSDKKETSGNGEMSSFGGIEGAIDGDFDINDIDIDNISLDDLLNDDFDDEDEHYAAGDEMSSEDIQEDEAEKESDAMQETASAGMSVEEADSKETDAKEAVDGDEPDDAGTETIEAIEDILGDADIDDGDGDADAGAVMSETDEDVPDPDVLEAVNALMSGDDGEEDSDNLDVLDAIDELMADAEGGSDGDDVTASGDMESGEQPSDDADDIPLENGQEAAEAEDEAVEPADGEQSGGENEEDDSPEEIDTDLDLMTLLSDDGDDDLEVLDDEEQETANTKYTNDGRENVEEEKKAEVGKSDNVFADPLSVLSEDADDDGVAVGDVDVLLDNVVKKSRKKKKKKGRGIGKLFANIVDDKEIAKVEQEKADAERAEKKKELDAEKKRVKAEENAKKKEEDKLAKAQRKEEKKQEKEAKKRAKKEAKELRELEEESEIEGRINKVGAIIVFVVIGCMAGFVFVGTNIFSYNRSIDNAQNYFDNGKYEESYMELLGVDVKEEDELLYNKVVTIMYVYKQLDAYDMYYREGRYPEALDSLLKGIREYETYISDAIELDITDNMDAIKNQIVTELSLEYGITEEMAKEINQIEDSEEYSRRVYDLAQNLASTYY